MNVIEIIPLKNSLSETISLSGSKSYMNRALVLASLSSKPSHLKNPSNSNDSELLINALLNFGVEFKKSDGVLQVVPSINGLTPFCGVIDVGPAGTVSRFLTALIAAVPGTEVQLVGSSRMYQRPIAPLVDALRDMGAKIEYLKNEGSLPLLIHGRKLSGGDVSIDGSISSQFITALMLAAPLYDNTLNLIPKNDVVISKSYLNLTHDTLSAFGIKNSSDGVKVEVVNEQPNGIHYLVEGDASSATYMWGLAALTGGSIIVGPFSRKSLQGDAQFPYLLEKMGCGVFSKLSPSITGEQYLGIKGVRDRKLQGISVNMEDMPDAAQTLAVIAAVSRGVTEITGLSTLRDKETDRIKALQTELEKLGVPVKTGRDSITITGIESEEIQGARIETYDDHRMAMSFALLGAFVPGIIIEDPEVVKKSFPDFWEKLESFGVSYL